MNEQEMPSSFDLICGKEELFCEGPVYSESGYTGAQVQQFMIEFAKLHVEAALKAAADKATLNRVSLDKVVKVTISDYSIRSAYPPENIK
jgi:hypothetical protein